MQPKLVVNYNPEIEENYAEKAVRQSNPFA
jgi:hypothetical protein